MAISHTFQSAIADGGDATLVQPSDWNADHTVADPGIAVSMAPAGNATIPANSCFVVDDEFTVADGMELVIEDGASMVII